MIKLGLGLVQATVTKRKNMQEYARVWKNKQEYTTLNTLKYTPIQSVWQEKVPQ